jgi:(2Fe-2S) ferredoxin
VTIEQDASAQGAPAFQGPQGAPAQDAPRSAIPDQLVFICEASDCRIRGASEVRQALAGALAESGCATVGVVRTGCLSLCGAGPAVVTYPATDVHLHVQPADAKELAAQLAVGAPLQRRRVRVPPWYRDHISSRLAYVVRLLRARATAGLNST